MGRVKTVSHMTKEILNELEKQIKPAEKKKEPEKPKLDQFNAVRLRCLFFAYYPWRTSEVSNVHVIFRLITRLVQ